MAVVRVSTERLSTLSTDIEKFLMFRAWRRASLERQIYRGREWLGSKVIR